VVAAEHDPLAREAQPVCDAEDEVPEVARAHPGVAAELVDLIGGRLDEHVGSVCRGLQHRRLEHRRVR
jgi:hypothetical protein